MSEFYHELDDCTKSEDLAKNILGGHVYMLRSGLQQLNLFDQMAEAGIEGIRESAGPEVADRVAQEGFDRIHEYVGPDAIPALTDAVYFAFTRRAASFLDEFVPRVFPKDGMYYFEHTPNVRFHIPYDIAAPFRKKYDQFAEKHGQGKIAPHGPHRDSWLDCPDNVVNIWIAVGPVQRGNGLSIFAEDHQTKLSFQENGEIADGEKLTPPLNFDMSPGDVLLFHSDQLHASELNRTDATRFVVSYRISFGKPHFPNGHYHEYDHAGLARSGGQWMAKYPAMLQWSFFSYRLQWLLKKLTGGGPKENGKPASGSSQTGSVPSAAGDQGIPLSDLPVGSLRAVTSGVCVARVSDDRVVALSRRCPHKGADLSTGFVLNGEIVCPWHNVNFDPETGASPCESLHSLRRFACEIRDERVHVQTDKPLDGSEQHDASASI